MHSHTPCADTAPLVHGTTELIYIVADPVAQAKVPEVLNRVFSWFGCDAIVVPAKVNDHCFEGFLRGALSAGNVRGMLVSIPHKTRLMRLADRSDTAARMAGAANAVRVARDGALEGALFDGSGFVKALRHHGVVFAGRRIWLAGAGGAGLAIASAVGNSAEGPAEIAVYDTASERAHDLVNRLKPNLPAHVVLSAPGENDPSGFQLVINATPLGLNPSDPLPFDPAMLDGDAVVLDILMKDQPTPLERACLALDITVHPGHEMLLQQIPEYLSFFGFDGVAAELRQVDHPVMSELRSALLRGRLELAESH